MTAIAVQNEMLHVEQCSLAALAERYGTPLYVYSRAMIESRWRELQQGLQPHPHRICYAVKANSNLAVLSVLAKLGSSFDIVSVGELERVLAAGGRASDCVFSGVGKHRAEIHRALQAGVACFNIESESELQRLAQISSEAGCVAPISLRVNPDVDAGTHPYISTGLKDNKFGIGWQDCEALYQRAAEHPWLRVIGIDMHIGSQLVDGSPYLAAMDRLLALVDRLAERGIHIEHLDIGGGFGVQYRDETRLDTTQLFAELRQRLAGRRLELWIEPGRSIVADAGVLLTRVEYLKRNEDKHFAVVDASMSECIRPALYGAWMEIVTVQPSQAPVRVYDIVGPVCESSDFLGKSRALALAEGDLLAMRSAGAYCFGMSSNYNTRVRPAELMIDGDRVHVARRREVLSDLWALEAPL